MSQKNVIEIILRGKADGALASIASVQRGVAGLATKLAGFALAVGGAVVSLRALEAGMRNVVGTGLKFNSTLETARIGVAGILRSTQPERFKTFTDALDASAEAVEKLRKAAAKSPATVKELVESFQGITGPATQGGMSLNQQVDLAVTLSQALSSAGIASHQLLQESRALITGQIDRNALLAKYLGLTSQDVQRAKEQGQLYEFLTDKLKGFREGQDAAANSLSVRLSNLEDAWDYFTGKLTEPVLDPLKDAILELTERLQDSAIYAQAFTMGLVEAFQNNQLVEFLALAVRAGIEKGVQLFADGGGPGILETLLRGVAHAVVNSTVWLIDKLIDGLVTGLQFALAGLKVAVGDLAIGLQKMIHALPAWMRPSGENGTIFGDEPLKPQSFDEALGDVLRNFNSGPVTFDAVRLGFIEALQGAVDSYFSNGGSQGGALAEFTAELERQKKLIEEAEAASRKETGALDEKPKVQASINDLLESEKRLTADLVKLETERQRIEADFRLTSVEKRREKLKVLAEELALIDRMIAEMEARAAGLGEGEQSESIRQRIDGLRGKRGKLEGDVLGLGADPESFTDQWQSALTKLEDSLGTFATNSANLITGTLQAAFDGVADSITGLIYGTRSWGQVWMQVGQQIVSQLIKIFLTELVWRGVLKAFKKASHTEEMTQQATEIPGKVVGATADSISSYGVAAAVGVAAVLAALASVAAFAEGGIVKGGEQLIRVNEMGTEAVLNARAVGMMGENAIAALNRGESPSRALESSPGLSRGGGGQQLNVAVLDSEERYEQWARSQNGQTVLMDLVRREIHAASARV